MHRAHVTSLSCSHGDCTTVQRMCGRRWINMEIGMGKCSVELNRSSCHRFHSVTHSLTYHSRPCQSISTCLFYDYYFLLPFHFPLRALPLFIFFYYNVSFAEGRIWFLGESACNLSKCMWSFRFIAFIFMKCIGCTSIGQEVCFWWNANLWFGTKKGRQAEGDDCWPFRWRLRVMKSDCKYKLIIHFVTVCF